MPRIPSSSVTFAFSKRQEKWTTRYSFTPTCYANCGDVMLSSKDINGVWKHDANESRNTFYGDQYSSQLELIFNDYPSEPKVFKAVSIETNQNLWIGQFKTNEEHEGRNNQDSPPLLSLKDKEGVKYAEIPRSIKNSTANVFAFPSVEVNDEAAFNNAVVDLDAFSLFHVDLLVDGIQLSAMPSLPITGSSSEILLRKPSGDAVNFHEFLADNYPSLSNYPFSGLNSGIKSVFAVAVSDNLVTFRSSRPQVQPSVSVFQDFLVAFSDFLSAGSLILKSSASINGDHMRGPYVNVHLTSLGNNPLELYSVNVDYEISSSAARLTQNS